MDSKTVNIVTHNGRFHADEVFAVATLKLVFKNARVTRTRDEEVIKKGPIVLDVGGVYDEKNNRFDHHQEGGAGARPNSAPYAAFGLVWKKFGEQISKSKAVADFIDQKLVQVIDSVDNGIEVSESILEGVNPYTIQAIIFAWGSTWHEKDRDQDLAFLEIVEIAQKILEREIRIAADSLESDQLVISAYEKAEDKRIVVLDDNYLYQLILSKFPEPLYVVIPNSADATWKVECVRNDPYNYANRKPMPAAWAGKRDVELAKVSGVPDAIFCHNKLFLSVAKSKEGAIALAKKALQA